MIRSKLPPHELLMSGLMGDTSIASQFGGLRVSPFSSAKLLTVSICSCNVARELLIVGLSSTWMNVASSPGPVGPEDEARMFTLVCLQRTARATHPRPVCVCLCVYGRRRTCFGWFM